MNSFILIEFFIADVEWFSVWFIIIRWSAAHEISCCLIIVCRSAESTHIHVCVRCLITDLHIWADLVLRSTGIHSDTALLVKFLANFRSVVWKLHWWILFNSAMLRSHKVITLFCLCDWCTWLTNLWNRISLGSFPVSHCLFQPIIWSESISIIDTIDPPWAWTS